MVKKLITLAFGLSLAFGVAAQGGNDIVPQSDIEFWTGTGSNQAVVAITWDDDVAGAIGIAWGVRWDGPAVVKNLIDTIAAYDPRFTITYSSSNSFVSNFAYVDDELGLDLLGVADWWGYLWYDASGTSLTTTSLGIGYDAVAGGHFVDWMQTSAADLMIMATDPNGTTPEPDPLCDVMQELPYSQTFSDCPDGQRPFEAGAPIPYCWAIRSNGLYTRDTTSDAAIYFSGVGTSTSTNNYGCVTAGSPFLSLIACQIYTGDDASHIAQMRNYGTRKYAILPRMNGAFDQLTLNFDYRTSNTGACLLLGYITAGDTSTFVTLDSMPSDFRVLHHVAVRLDTMAASYPADARLALCWKTTSSVSDAGPGNRFCGIDNVHITADATSEEPVDATVALADLRCWAGEGSDSAALIVNFANPDTAFAWGVLFNGSTTPLAMLNAVAAVDTHLTISGRPDAGSGQINYTLADGTVLSRVGSQWIFNYNGEDAWGDEDVHNGDVYKFGDPVSGEQVGTFQYIWTKQPTIVDLSTPIDPLPEEATIAASDILYWVGEGSNQVVLAVNWADTALAWGYRFSTESVSVSTVMADIAAADPRFSYTGSGFIGDINYIDTAAGMTDTLRGSSYWESKRNGIGDAGMAQSLVNGDFEKWATPAAGVVVDSTYWDGFGWGYTYVYPMAITPVSVPDTTGGNTPVDHNRGPFCGAAGTPGSDAIRGDSNIFVAWATGCVVNRGPDNIANPDGPMAHYGHDTMALGPVDINDNLTVVSLGDGGTALVTFARPITNGEGPDFAVFENGFDDSFLELAFVEVSTDGERFVRFPATSLTPTETQASTIDPTFINNLAGKYRMGFGTPFDLEELRDSTGINIDSIVYVRIVDVVGSIDPRYATYDAFGHIVNDPWPTGGFGSSGFDLDAVGVIHQLPETQGIVDAEVLIGGLWPNPTADVVNVSLRRAAEAALYDLTGRRVAVFSLAAGRNTLNLSDLSAGVYMLRVEGSVNKIVKR